MDTDTRNADALPASDPDDDAPVEMSTARRTGVTLFVLAVLAVTATSLMPPTVLRDRIAPVVTPVAVATGLDQAWGMFAPNPQQVSTEVRARVERSDGTTADYTIPHGRGLDAYWDYRWLKYGDQIAEDKKTDDERIAFARWAIEQDRAAGGDPRRVVLLRLAQRLLPPGPGPDAGPPQVTPIYVGTVEGAR